MSTPFSRAPHIEGPVKPPTPAHAPNAALLIDFDNVTMGMRSDLSKELKSLLNSDVIKGKVTVQRAYADWRRYPQYIVPLSEASVDLIFAPAYGSSKKNATDIRMAIDGMELVFTRPEIGVYILLTGDSDFSSLVLKLKEYGKYVIGVGIQESSSDILVQNCDEYYSYTSLSGLRKTSEAGERTALDPWLLVEKAVEQMTKRGDIMRSDRLKQVMLEIDPGFDEKSFGYSKFSRFVTEAAQKGLIQLRKMENGQYEVSAPKGAGAEAKGSSREPRSGNGRAGSRRSEGGQGRRSEARKPSDDQPAAPAPGPVAKDEPSVDAPAQSSAGDGESKGAAYDLLTRAVRDLLGEDAEGTVRDSDVKRRMLQFDASFDEAELGFPKFSRFVRQASDDGVITFDRGENGEYQLRLAGGPDRKRSKDPQEAKPKPKPEPDAAVAPSAPSSGADRSDDGSDARRLRPRLSARRRGASGEPPPLFEGQVVKGASAETKTREATTRSAKKPEAESPAMSTPDSESKEVYEPSELKLPTGRASVIKYLSNSYRGVGQKTAESLVDELGESLFTVLQTDPERVERILTPARAEKLLEAWKEDFERRRARVAAGSRAN